MGFGAILRAFGFLLVILGVGMIAPGLVALDAGDQGDYFFAAAAAMFAGGGLTVVTRGARQSTDVRGAILLVTLWWGVAPAFCATPFILDGASFLDAYFEATSALTTTGAWLSQEALQTSPAGILWRAIMQWIGGLTSISVAAAIFIRPELIGTDTLLPPFSRGDRDSYVFALQSAFGIFARIYGLITIVFFGAFLFAAEPPLSAAVLALSGVASGGLTPYGASGAELSSATAGVLFPLTFLSGVNFIVLTRLILQRETSLRDIETGAYFFIAIAVAVLLAASAGEIFDARALARHLFDAVSLVATNGVVLGSPPLALALVTILIGGSAISTAGGLKILRWLVIMNRMRQEIGKLVNPRGVFARDNVQNELGVWMHFLVFTMILGVLILILTAGGNPFDISVAAAAGALSNAGPVLYLADPSLAGYEVFDDAALKAALIGAMILGRVEGVAALALLNRAFWRS